MKDWPVFQCARCGEDDMQPHGPDCQRQPLERDVRDSFGSTQVGNSQTLAEYLTEKEIGDLEDAIDRANSAAFAARAARIRATRSQR